MKYILVILLLSLNSLFAQIPAGKGIPDLKAHDADGKTFSLKERLSGNYSVVVFGCLTWPPFLRNVPGLETIQRDYATKGVRFYYIYKALAHPEKDGYVQPLTLEERLLHVAAAKKKLGTKWEWIVDDMDNSLKHAFGDRPNSEFVIDPEGKIVRSRQWSSAAELRADMEELVGPVEKITKVSDLDLPESGAAEHGKIAQGVVKRIPLPEGARPVKVSAVKSDEPFYIKLRAEATSGLLRDGKGTLHLGFHIDPIHNVHWNNLAKPLEFEIKSGGTFSPNKATAQKIEAEADADPREFLIEAEAAVPGKPITIEVRYFACDNGDAWCKAVTQTFEIALEYDRDAGNPRRGGGTQARRPQAQGMGTRRPDPAQILSRFDTDKDGKISKKEARGPMVDRFESMDTDKDGYVTEEELRLGMRRR